jgi:hypothetical protein
MRLSVQSILPLLAAVIACNDSLAPRDVAGVYFLERINGQNLPVVIGPIPEETITVISGEIALYEDRNAVTVERRREVRNNIPSENNYVFEQRFELDGNRISIGPRSPCPPNANCVEITGVITDSILTLEIGQFTYRYRRADFSI